MSLILEALKGLLVPKSTLVRVATKRNPRHSAATAAHPVAALPPLRPTLQPFADLPQWNVGQDLDADTSGFINSCLWFTPPSHLRPLEGVYLRCRLRATCRTWREHTRRYEIVDLELVINARRLVEEWTSVSITAHTRQRRLDPEFDLTRQPEQQLERISERIALYRSERRRITLIWRNGALDLPADRRIIGNPQVRVHLQ